MALWSWDISVPLTSRVLRGRGVIPGCPGRPTPAGLVGVGGAAPLLFGVFKHGHALRSAARPTSVDSGSISAMFSLRGRGHAIAVVEARSRSSGL